MLKAKAATPIDVALSTLPDNENDTHANEQVSDAGLTTDAESDSLLWSLDSWIN